MFSLGLKVTCYRCFVGLTMYVNEVWCLRDNYIGSLRQCTEYSSMTGKERETCC